jgi:L-ribulose-5-phosphate 4-epimerase
MTICVLDPLRVPGVLVASYTPFWRGKTPAEAAPHAVILEEIAAMALQTIAINSKAKPIGNVLRNRHFRRKHGIAAPYRQKKS